MRSKHNSLLKRDVGDTESPSPFSPEQLARKQLESMGVSLREGKDGTITFVIPKTLEEKLRKVYKFSIKEMKIGGDIPLSELARHVDEQSAMEARAGTVAEFAKHQLNQAQLEYDLWYNTMFWKAKQTLDNKPSDKAIHSYIIYKYGKKWRKKQQVLNELGFSYRLINNAIRAAWITKGRLLQTLRLIVQGSNAHIAGGIDAEIEDGGYKVKT